MLNEVKTVKQRTKRSVFCDLDGNILYPDCFIVENMVYYDMLEKFHQTGSSQLLAKIHRERQKVKNMIKVHFKSYDDFHKREEEYIAEYGKDIEQRFKKYNEDINLRIKGLYEKSIRLAEIRDLVA